MIRADVRRALDRALEGHPTTREEALLLAELRGPELQALAGAADELRRRQAGEVVTYVVNRNLNFTNVCIKRCGFCAFSRDHRTEEAWFLPLEEILRQAGEAVDLGATEVCLQAGLSPQLPGYYYPRLARALKERFPKLHLHAFSPEEVLYGALRSRRTVEDYLRELKDAGLDTLPGTSAELLVQEMRDRISPGRITVEQWVDVVTTAHRLGLRTTSTMMYGHLDEPWHRVEHLLLLRDLQARTGGFTEFVPLSFVHAEAPMFRTMPGVRAGAPGAEVLNLHALARVVLGASFRNIQASWVKEGPRLAQLLLDAGCNDLGGTLMNESISTTAGAQFGQLVPPKELRRLIRDAGREPAQRNTVYELLPPGEAALDEVEDAEARFGSYRELAGSGAFRFRHPAAGGTPGASSSG